MPAEVVPGMRKSNVIPIRAVPACTDVLARLATTRGRHTRRAGYPPPSLLALQRVSTFDLWMSSQRGGAR
jgi:hypothetical protein